MDFKLFACSSVAIASFSVLLFDYATFSPNTVASPTHTASVSTASVKSTADSLLIEPSVDSEVALVRVEAATTELADTVLVSPPERLKIFDSPMIASVLKPVGLNRSDWTVNEGSLWVSSKPFETQQMVVMLDPGHGGTDPGAIAHNGLVEKHLTLDIAKRTRQHLAKYPNIDVQFTRDDDAGMSRSTRVKKIRHSDADIVISLHFNDLPQKNIALVETYYAGMANIEDSLSRRSAHGHSHTHGSHSIHTMANADFSFTQGSKQLAQMLHKHVYGEVEQDNTAAQDAGVKSDTLFVLTQSYKTGALMELTCLSHPGEADKLLTDEYRDRLSKALASAILEYRRTQIKSPLITPPGYSKPASIVNWTPDNMNQLFRDPHSV